VPLQIHKPEIKTAEKRTTSLAELIDLFLTLTELCKLPIPRGLEGTSLVPVRQNPA
jgi:iduronate 2-sulfatase